MVTRLTRRHEDHRDAPWAVADAPPDYISGQLRGIVGVELAIDTVEAKHKLSQNRSAEDQAAVAAALAGEPGPGPAGIAALMAPAEPGLRYRATPGAPGPPLGEDTPPGASPRSVPGGATPRSPRIRLLGEDTPPARLPSPASTSGRVPGRGCGGRTGPRSPRDPRR